MELWWFVYHCLSIDVKCTDRIDWTEKAVDFRASDNKPGEKKVWNSCKCARLHNYDRELSQNNAKRL